MAKQITLEQSHAVVAALMLNIDWASLDGELLQETVIRNAKEAGRQCTAFLQVGARMYYADLRITTAPFKPEKWLGEGWKPLLDRQDKRSAELREVDFAKARLVNCVEIGKSDVGRKEKYNRLKASGVILHGATVFMGLWLDYQARGNASVLETLHHTKGVKYIDFFGDVFEGPEGDIVVLCLIRDKEGKWHRSYNWPESGLFDADNLTSVSE